MAASDAKCELKIELPAAVAYPYWKLDPKERLDCIGKGSKLVKQIFYR
jgi:hypothetical protein